MAVIELGWVLSSAYGLTREQVRQALRALLRTKELVVERTDQLVQASRIFRAGKDDLADCLQRASQELTESSKGIPLSQLLAGAATASSRPFGKASGPPPRSSTLTAIRLSISSSPSATAVAPSSPRHGRRDW